MDGGREGKKETWEAARLPLAPSWSVLISSPSLRRLGDPARPPPSPPPRAPCLPRPLVYSICHNCCCTRRFGPRSTFTSGPKPARPGDVIFVALLSHSHQEAMLRGCAHSWGPKVELQVLLKWAFSG